MGKFDAVITTRRPADSGPPHLFRRTTRFCTIALTAIPSAEIASTSSRRWAVPVRRIRRPAVALPSPAYRITPIPTAILTGAADVVMRVLRRRKGGPFSLRSCMFRPPLAFLDSADEAPQKCAGLEGQNACVAVNFEKKPTRITPRQYF